MTESKLTLDRIKYRWKEFLHQDDVKWEGEKDKSKKTLLIYAHYYYPDVASTGQILTELAEGLRDTFNIVVICTVPSYTGQTTDYYKRHKYYYEKINGVNVIRIRVPRFRKNFSISRIYNIVAYFLSAILATFRVGKCEYVFTISQPPVLGGLLGVIGKTIKRAKLIYNIQDFNPEQIQAVSFTQNKLIIDTMMMLDKYSCKRSDKIILVGRDMIDTLKGRFPKDVPSYSHINNWIDEKSVVPLSETDERVLEFRRKYGLEDKFVIMYSGNIGLYYDLVELAKIFGKCSEHKEVVFAFVGAGSVLEDIKKLIAKEKYDNIVLVPYQNKEDLVYSLNAGNVHLVVNAKGIKGVSVPSKLYGVMAAAKPILGILEEGSEARLIIEESSCGLVATPRDYDAIKKLLQQFIDMGLKDKERLISMGKMGRDYLEKNLSRDISINKYAEEISKL